MLKQFRANECELVGGTIEEYLNTDHFIISGQSDSTRVVIDMTELLGFKVYPKFLIPITAENPNQILRFLGYNLIYKFSALIDRASSIPS